MIPISPRSYTKFSTSEAFISSLVLLTDLQEMVSLDYDNLKKLIGHFKRSKISFIGNPFIKLHTDLVEVTYLLKLHILNCRVYNDLLFEDTIINEDLNLQLESLLATTNDLYERYYTIREELQSTPYPKRSSHTM